MLADPHEVANVAGEEGVRWFVDLGRNLILRIYWAVPSVAPIVSSDVETPNSILDPGTIERLAHDPAFVSLGEIHDYRGVVRCDDRVTALGDVSLRTGLRIEGHIPDLLGMDLSRYTRLGVVSDHTLMTPEKIEEELSKGLYVMLQRKSLTEGNITVIKNLTDKSRVFGVRP